MNSLSATDYYKSGRFDAALLTVLDRYETGARDRAADAGARAARDLFALPADLARARARCCRCRSSNGTSKTGTIVFDDEGMKTELPVTGGHVKCQWKADWAMRWLALGVDYEMAGKDLISSVELSSKIVRVLGGEPPEGFNYELFLDESSQKISKSKGNGLVGRRMAHLRHPGKPFAVHVPEAARGQAALFRRHPQGGGRLYRAARMPITPTMTTEAERLENPVWHIHAGAPPDERYPVSFALLLNLVSASHAHNREVLWGFIRAYAPGASPNANPGLEKLVSHAIGYYEDFVKPQKKYRAPDDKERAALSDLADALEALGDERDGATVQNVVYEIGKKHGSSRCAPGSGRFTRFCSARTQGPRFGTFAALFGCSADRRSHPPRARGRICCHSMYLARPDDAVDEGDLGEREAAVLVGRVEAFELDALGGHAAELLGHHLAGMGLGHHPVAAPQIARRRHHDAVAVAVHRQHRIADDLERIGMFVGEFGKGDLLPARAGREIPHRRNSLHCRPAPCR